MRKDIEVFPPPSRRVVSHTLEVSSLLSILVSLSILHPLVELSRPYESRTTISSMSPPEVLVLDWSWTSSSQTIHSRSTSHSFGPRNVMIPEKFGSLFRAFDPPRKVSFLLMAARIFLMSVVPILVMKNDASVHVTFSDAQHPEMFFLFP